MKKLLGLFGLLLTLMPISAIAQKGVDGTWKIDLNKAQLDAKPRVYSLKDGMYSCTAGCDPKITIKADGKDQKVSGSPYFDTARVTVVNDSTVEMVGTKDAKVTLRASMTISPDGKTLTRKFEQHTPSGQMSTSTATYSRVGEPEAGAHAISGSWKTDKIESASENWLTFTFASTGDGLRYKASTGESYNAKFDGKDYPYMGDPGTTSVVLKQIDSNTYEETDKRNGKVVGISRLSVSPDGQSLTMVSEDKLRGVTDTFVAEKAGQAMADK